MLRLVLSHVHDTATNGDATRAVTPIDYTANKTPSSHFSLIFKRCFGVLYQTEAKTKPATFETSARRNVAYLIEAVGDKDMATYRSWFG
jgi:hypothetical protein